MIATVNYHSSFLRPWCQSIWTNTLPRHFCRGPASHKSFDFLPSIYPFYMFLGRRLVRRSLGGGRSLGEGGYTAKTFSVHRRVHNHFTKRILNLILNRKNFAATKRDFRQAKLRGFRGMSLAVLDAPPRWHIHRGRRPSRASGR